jgi:uncharacterized protein (DUF433 family)
MEDLPVDFQWQDYIEERKGVMAGKPVFKGTRLTVEFILKQLGANMSPPDLLDQYPTLKPEHLRAAMVRGSELEEGYNSRGRRLANVHHDRCP